MSVRRDMVGTTEQPAPSIRRQCKLANVARSTWHRNRGAGADISDGDLELMGHIDRIYTDHPEYGSRRITWALDRHHGIRVNRKHVQRLMRTMDISGCLPGPNTSKPAPENKVFPYLLRGVDINRCDQVWSTDITFVPLGKSFVYLTAVIDWHSRYVLSWELSNSMDASFCVEVLNQALTKGKPEIFNTDQGSQYTSDEFQKQFRGTGIKISMDGKGRALDNVFVERLWRSVKYEDIYLRGYQTMPELYRGLIRYFHHYNHERPHFGLNGKTPAEVYCACRRFAPTSALPGCPSGDGLCKATTTRQERSDCQSLPNVLQKDETEVSSYTLN